MNRRRWMLGTAAGLMAAGPLRAADVAPHAHF